MADKTFIANKGVSRIPKKRTSGEQSGHLEAENCLSPLKEKE
jgi:hypothetical protein